MMNVLKLWIATLFVAWNACGQGVLFIYNPQAPTRLGSADGPLAGPGIWGQMFAGPTPGSLSPVGSPVVHNLVGILFHGGVAPVPGVPCYTIGYAQLIAWDGRLWGTDLGNVPPDQRGATDVVPVGMPCESPFSAPHFTQPAIVPIPEPGVASLFALGCGVAAIGLFRLRQKR